MIVPAVALIIPFVRFTVTVPVYNIGFLPYRSEAFELSDFVPLGFSLDNILIVIIFLVSFILLLLLVRNVFKLSKLARYPSFYWRKIPVKLVEFSCPPHSLGNCIIVNRQDFESGKIEERILLHEQIHIQQKHILDLVWIELLQAVAWFNPFIYLFKNAIRLNHEYLADTSVVDITKDNLAYQQLLLKNVYVNHHIPLASSFYFFTIKKRLLMLQKKANPIDAGIKAMLSMILIAGITFFFSERTYAQVAPPPPPSPPEALQSGSVRKAIAGLRVLDNKGTKTARLAYRDGTIITADISTKEKEAAFEEKYGIRIPTKQTPIDIEPGTGANSREIAEYESISEKLNHFAENGGESPDVNLVRYMDIYLKMTTKQREAAIPLAPPPPPAPPAPPSSK